MAVTMAMWRAASGSRSCDSFHRYVWKALKSTRSSKSTTALGSCITCARSGGASSPSATNSPTLSARPSLMGSSWSWPYRDGSDAEADVHIELRALLAAGDEAVEGDLGRHHADEEPAAGGGVPLVRVLARHPHPARVGQAQHAHAQGQDEIHVE